MNESRNEGSADARAEELPDFTLEALAEIAARRRGRRPDPIYFFKGPLNDFVRELAGQGYVLGGLPCDRERPILHVSGTGAETVLLDTGMVVVSSSFGYCLAGAREDLWRLFRQRPTLADVFRAPPRPRLPYKPVTG
jgi:hypothetical protein